MQSYGREPLQLGILAAVMHALRKLAAQIKRSTL